MVTSLRRALVTSVGLMLLRRKLQRQSGPAAAVALVGLELFGPRILLLRRLLLWLVLLTVVGAVVAGAVWWWLRSNAAEPEPIPAAAPPAPQPAPPVDAAGAEPA
jgi:hypothetical protein